MSPMPPPAWLEAASMHSRGRGSPAAARLGLGSRRWRGGPWLEGELGIALFTSRQHHERRWVTRERAESWSPSRGADVAWMGFHARPQ